MISNYSCVFSVILELITGLQIQTWTNELGNLLLVTDAAFAIIVRPLKLGVGSL